MEVASYGKGKDGTSSDVSPPWKRTSGRDWRGPERTHRYKCVKRETPTQKGSHTFREKTETSRASRGSSSR